MAKLSPLRLSFTLACGLAAAPMAGAQNATLGEIKTFAFSYCPTETMPADGRLLSVNNDVVLYATMAATFGGTDTTTFNLPDLSGRGMMGRSDTQALGKKVGAASAVLANNNLPLRLGAGVAMADPGTAPTAGGNSLRADGIGTPVPTMPPYLALTQCISSNGTFPTPP